MWINIIFFYSIHLKYKSQIIKNLIKKNVIIKHEALEYKAFDSREKIKYVQYEDCFIIKDNKLINLSK